MDQNIELDDWLDQLDTVLARVADGETVTITRHGTPVASLGPRPGIEPAPQS